MPNEMYATGDHLLLKRAIRQRDRDALRVLYARYYARLKRYIASGINSPSEAEDLAQELFVQLWRLNGNRSCDCRNAEAYLFGIARNLIRQHHRDAAKLPKPLDARTLEIIAAERRGPAYPARRPAASDDAQELITKALNRLPPAVRQALKFTVIEGLGPDQAARRADCSVNAFYQRLHVARKTLSQLLAEHHQPKT